MKGLIILVIYFSGTGNSRYAAEALAKRLNDSFISSNEYIKEGKTADFSSEKPYIFVAPTYSWRMPRIFSDFIRCGKFAGSTSVYFVLTCGDDIGNAARYSQELCKEKKFYYMGMAMLLMPENYVAMFDVTDEKESEKRLGLADIKLKLLSELIAAKSRFPVERRSFLSAIKSGCINPLFYERFVSAQGFWVSDKCVGCGKCETLCPFNNITMTDGKPLYGDRCTHCMACICGCPAEAIEYKKRTAGKARYYNEKQPVIE